MTIPLDTVLPIYSFINHSSRSKVEWFIFYLCSCLSTQFLYRTAVKATFNVKDNIKDIIKNSITLTINITTFPTMQSQNWWQNRSTNYQFPMSLFYNTIFDLSTLFVNFYIFVLCSLLFPFF